MPGKAAGRAAVDLPWLCPNTDSLVGLAEQPANLMQLASADPGLFVFLVRFAMADDQFTPSPDRLVAAALPETAAAYLAATRTGWLDPASFPVKTVNEVTTLAAAFARELAVRTGRGSPDAAAAAARLAPLGWYATAAVNTTPQLTDPELDRDGVARRLASRWRFPHWLTTIVGCSNLPFEATRHLGANADLFAIVSLAVREAQRRTTDLGLTTSAEVDRLLAHLELPADALGSLENPVVAPIEVPRFDPNPHRVPLVASLLQMAGAARRRNGAALVVKLETRIDSLHRAATDLADVAGTRLRDAKLEAMAELAAGAGHEINNPLTVISGNAQRLLRTEQDDDRADTLRSIVRQSQRISGILRELMQFARPSESRKELVRASDLMVAVRADLATFAEECGVRFDLVNAPAAVLIRSDPKQVRHALGAVARNGIEAAGQGGWVRLDCTAVGSECRFAVEDSGPGLAADIVEHAFDPFYCGRGAGRGRGLGLPTAWQLARQNGGTVGYEPAGGATRFVFTFPLAAAEPVSERQSA